MAELNTNANSNKETKPEVYPKSPIDYPRPSYYSYSANKTVPNPPPTTRHDQEAQYPVDTFQEYLKRLNECRFTLIGASGHGKTSFKNTLKAVLLKKKYIVTPELGAAAAAHGTRWMTQETVPIAGATGAGEQKRIILTDMKGINPDADDCEEIANDLHDIVHGVFPSELMVRPELMAGKIVEKFQHGAIIVIDASTVIANSQTHAEFIIALINTLRQNNRYVPFVIVLTFVDKLDTGKLQDAIDKIVSATATHKAFVIPVFNCIEDEEKPSQNTINSVYRALGKLLITSTLANEEYKPGFYTKAKRKARDVGANVKKSSAVKYSKSIGKEYMIIIALLAFIAFLLFQR